MRLVLPTVYFFLAITAAASERPCPEGSERHGQAPPAGNEVKCVLPDGTLHGPSQHWYSNGQLMDSLTYDHGREHGEQKAWWPNGRKMMEGVSMDGKRYQGFRYWDISGRESKIQFETIEERLPANP